MSALFFGHAAWGNITLPAEVFPRHVVGTITGLGGCLGGAAGVVTQLGIGWVVQNLSFGPIFGAISVAYLIAFLAVQGLIGELGRVRVP
jgi:ACS family hexuronate transporter-like MFS transporter